MRTVDRVFQTLAVFVAALPLATGQTPFLGVLVEEVFAAADAEPGVTVVSVDPDSAAWRAGVENDDRIVGLGDQIIADREDLADVLQGHVVGDRLPLVLVRAGERWHTKVRLAQRPVTPKKAPPVPMELHASDVDAEDAGVDAAPWPGQESWHEPETDLLRDEPVLAAHQEEPRGWLGIEVEEFAEGPLVIVLVEPGSPADRAGFKVEDELSKADGVRLENLDSLSAVLDRKAPGDVVTLEFLRQGDRLNAKARLGLAPVWSEAVPAVTEDPAPVDPAPVDPAPPEPAPPLDQRVSQLETMVVDLQRELAARTAQFEESVQQRNALQERLDRQDQVLQQILTALQELDKGTTPGSPLQE